MGATAGKGDRDVKPAIWLFSDLVGDASSHPSDLGQPSAMGRLPILEPSRRGLHNAGHRAREALLTPVSCFLSEGYEG
jgi:hypothetical protein